MGALRSILHQLFTQKERLLSGDILRKFEKGKALRTSFVGLWDVLINVARNANGGEIICILDALDEIHENERSRLVEALKEFYESEQSGSTLKFIITTRPHLLIIRDFRTKSQRIIQLDGDGQIDEISQEIDLVIEVKVKEVSERLGLHNDDEHLLKDELTSITNRTYLWVYLALDVVSKSIETDGNSIQKIIQNLPQTTEAAYEKILNRSKDRDTAKRILHIIIAATRPLFLEEMNIALAMAKDGQSQSTPELQYIPRFPEQLREMCGLFITIVESRVYLLHQTCREFLIQEVSTIKQGQHTTGAQSTQWRNSLCLMESNKLLAEISIRYLNLEDQSSRVFQQYAAENWTIHFQEAKDMNTEETIYQAKLLCDATSSQCVNWLEFNGVAVSMGSIIATSALVVASRFGLDQVVNLLLKDERVTLDSRDANKRSALSLACENGYDNIVKMLLSEKALAKVFKHGNIMRNLLKDMALATAFIKMKGNPLVKSKDKRNRTPLWYAATNGHIDIVKTLIEYGADVKMEDPYWAMPQTMAAMNGHIAVANLLLAELATWKNAIYFQIKSTNGRTPLHIAVQEGHKEMVKLLLEQGTQVDTSSYEGFIPLHMAARIRRGDIARLPLKKTPHVNARSKQNDTPLHLAALYNHEVISELLLDKGADVNARDNWGGEYATSSSS